MNLLERRIADLEARLAAVERELAADPLRAAFDIHHEQTQAEARLVAKMQSLRLARKQRRLKMEQLAMKIRQVALRENPLKVEQKPLEVPVQPPVVCHCGGAHKYLPPDPVLEAVALRHKLHPELLPPYLRDIAIRKRTR